MRPYYAYWEKRIFNAITKMIVRALAANKTIWVRNGEPYLIRMKSTYNYPEVLFHPLVDELRGSLDRFTKNILESTRCFGRWWDGFCKIFDEIAHEDNAEKYIPYTFFDDVMQNKMITQLNYEIVKCKNQIIDKFDLIIVGLVRRHKLRELFDKSKMTKTLKSIEKTSSTTALETYITSFQTLRQQALTSDFINGNYFVMIDSSQIQQKAIEKIDEWLKMLGDSLKSIASQELGSIIAQTEKYSKDLSKEVNDKESLQETLEVIAEIRNSSMEMEFRIIEVQEQYRVLNMYEYVIEEEVQKEVDTLMLNWQELIEFADKQDNHVKGFKKNFSEVTKQDVESFKEAIRKEWESYKARGPGTTGVSLEDGMALLNDSKAKIVEFNKTRIANVQAERLFNLEISKYPQLVEMEEDNKKYDEIYHIFDDFSKKIQEFGTTTFSKLDAKLLMETADKFFKDINRLANKKPILETMPPFLQLKERITGFRESLPLI